jgi:hypothetical protein
MGITIGPKGDLWHVDPEASRCERGPHPEAGQAAAAMRALAKDVGHRLTTVLLPAPQRVALAQAIAACPAACGSRQMRRPVRRGRLPAGHRAPIRTVLVAATMSPAVCSSVALTRGTRGSRPSSNAVVDSPAGRQAFKWLRVAPGLDRVDVDWAGTRPYFRPWWAVAGSRPSSSAAAPGPPRPAATSRRRTSARTTASTSSGAELGRELAPLGAGVEDPADRVDRAAEVSARAPQGPRVLSTIAAIAFHCCRASARRGAARARRPASPLPRSDPWRSRAPGGRRGSPGVRSAGSSAPACVPAARRRRPGGRRS